MFVPRGTRKNHHQHSWVEKKGFNRNFSRHTRSFFVIYYRKEIRHQDPWRVWLAFCGVRTLRPKKLYLWSLTTVLFIRCYYGGMHIFINYELKKKHDVEFYLKKKREENLVFLQKFSSLWKFLMKFWVHWLGNMEWSMAEVSAAIWYLIVAKGKVHIEYMSIVFRYELFADLRVIPRAIQKI